MRKLLLALVLPLVLAGCVHRIPYSQRFAGPVTIRLSNQCAYPLAAVHIRPTGTMAWGDDWMYSRGLVPPGQYVDFGVAPGIYDVRVLGPNRGVLFQARAVSASAPLTLNVVPGSIGPIIVQQ